ncbi:MAG: endolytic transglycosylase MltG [Clostridiales bacterium]
MAKIEVNEPVTPKKSHKGILIVVLSLFMVLVLAFVGLSYVEYRGILTKDGAKVLVPSGATTADIAEILQKNQIIKSKGEFRIIAKIKNIDGAWQMGNHEISAHSSYNDIFKELSTPQTADIKVTVPEGKQVKQIAKIYEKAGICSAADFMAACNMELYNYDFLKDITKRTDLEGYLFPDTYYFNKNTEPKIIINEMLRNFGNKVYTSTYQNRCEELGYSFDEIITLASIIESEAALKSDRYTISGVFHNRLNNWGAQPKLQSCVTVEYAMGVKKTIISTADTKFDSPYNTYLYPGLPIGPICCPGEMSLNAALYPESNSYYFFQSDAKGSLHFAETFSEHSGTQVEVQKDWHPVDDFED